MTTSADVDDEAVVDVRADILVLGCRGSKTEQAVELCGYVGIGLHHRYVLNERQHQFLVQARFDDGYPVIGSGNLVLQVFQFLGYVPLGIGECLLASPLLGHVVLVGVTHLKVVTEHIVESDFQTTDAGAFNLLPADTFDCLAAMIAQIAQLVKFVIYA